MPSNFFVPFFLKKNQNHVQSLYFHVSQNLKSSKKENEESLDSIIMNKFGVEFIKFKDSDNFPAVNRIHEIASFWVSEITNLITINEVDKNSRKNLQTSFCNSRYGSGKTRLGNILFDREYIKRNKEAILAEVEKIAKGDVITNISKILDSSKANIIQKLIDNPKGSVEGKNENAMTIFKAIFERIMGFYHFFAFFFNLRDSPTKFNFRIEIPKTRIRRCSRC